MIRRAWMHAQVRTTRYSAMFKVGYGAQCCRSAVTWDANYKGGP